MKTENKFYFSEDFYSKFPFTRFNEWHFGAKNEELQFNQVFTMLVNETQIHSVRSWLIFLNVAGFSSENNPNVDSSYIKVGTSHEKMHFQRIAVFPFLAEKKIPRQRFRNSDFYTMNCN